VYYSYFRLVLFLSPLLIKTPHLLHAPPTNYSCTPIFYFPLLSFFKIILSFYKFIYLFYLKKQKEQIYLKIIKIAKKIEKNLKDKNVLFYFIVYVQSLAPCDTYFLKIPKYFLFFWCMSGPSRRVTLFFQVIQKI